ncbi:MAG: hypothetical protein ACYDC1_00885 [Limisphaerales bacterium]
MVALTKRPAEAWCSPELLTGDFGHVVVARFKLNGDAEVGVFLVDRCCLGVKDGFFVQSTIHEYDTRFLPRVFPEDKAPLSPACARKLIEGAVAYAANLGFAPHEDYRKASRVLGGIDVADCATTFVYGKDGKPLYIQGPHDSPEVTNRILRTLEKRCGPGGYHFIVLGPTSEAFGSED